MQAKLRQWLWLFCWLPATTWANTMQIQPHQGGLQLVIPLHGPPTFSVYRLQHPTRLVLEFATTQSIQSQPPATWPRGPLLKLQLKAVIRDQTRRNKLILTLHQLDDYHLQLRAGWLLLTIIGATAPPTQPNILLAKVTPTPTITPTPRPTSIITPRRTPTIARPPRRTTLARAIPRPPPKYPWRTLANAAHQQWRQTTTRRQTLHRRETRSLLAQLSRRHQQWRKQLQRTATQRRQGLLPLALDPEQLPVTQEPIARQEKRIAKAQLAADAQLQRWFPEPEPRPTDTQAAARPLPTKARPTPPPLRVAMATIRPAPQAPRAPQQARQALLTRAQPVVPRPEQPQPRIKQAQPIPRPADRSPPTRTRVAAVSQPPQRLTRPSLPPGWEKHHAAQLRLASLAAHKVTIREDEFRSQQQARWHKQQRKLIEQTRQRQQMAQTRALRRQHEQRQTQMAQWRATFAAKSRQLSPIVAHRRAMDVFAMLQRQHRAPTRLAIALRKPPPQPVPTPRQPDPTRQPEPPSTRQPDLTPQPRPVPSQQPDLTPPPSTRQEDPAPSDTSGPLPTLLDAFRSLIPIARRKAAPPKPGASAHPSGPQGGQHQLLSMRFAQSLQTDRLLLTVQSPANARLSYALKGQGTRTLTLILRHTQAIEEEAVEPIDATMFLSYIGHVKAVTTSRQQLVIKISLTQTIRAKIQQTNTQLMIVFPRYGRRF